VGFAAAVAGPAPGTSAAADAHWLTRAADLSLHHMKAGHGGPFGACIVAADGRLLADGWNQVTSTHDPTAHAEVTAIRTACKAVGDFQLTGATLYTSCEPCPMCLASAYWARVDRIVFSNTRAEAAGIGFDDSFIYDEVAKAVGERAIPMQHVPLAAAAAAFAAWSCKADKVEY